MADPWLKFYPSDWMSEPKLKLVSRSARSLWIDMLCLMHQSGTGRLEVSGRAMTEKELASILGDNPRTIRKLIAELADAGVSTIVDGSFIASSRMIRDFEKAEQDRSNGRKGGNPSLKNNELGEKGVNPKVKAQKPEARSQIREEGLDKSNPPPPTGGGGFSDEDLRRLFSAVGYDPDGHIPAAWRDGAAERFAAWVASGLSPDRIIAAAKDSRKHHPEPPANPKALNGIMDRALAIPPKLTVVADQGAIDARNAQNIKDGKGFLVQSLSPGVIRGLIQKQLVTEEECQRAGVRI